MELCTADGAECLLQAVDEPDAQRWLAALRAAAALAPSTAAAPVEDEKVKAKSLFGFGKRK